MSLSTIAPQDALPLARANALIVDIREPDEYRRHYVEGSVNLPLSSLGTSGLPATDHDTVLFMCSSGNRTTLNAHILSSITEKPAFCIDGGITAMADAGFDIRKTVSAPIDVMRQVQIIAGSVGALGTILGALLSPWFLILPLLVGLGLTFAGISGFCGMAKLLQHMPWNKPAIQT
ncbi:rhodanese family protein [Coralliovum pocilloporae]|uniref:rhodanese family protein n=1 Tax=Coralliovum pocilloporae TaxID=3066369 RepID=UPI00330714E0